MHTTVQASFPRMLPCGLSPPTLLLPFLMLPGRSQCPSHFTYWMPSWKPQACLGTSPFMLLKIVSISLAAKLVHFKVMRCFSNLLKGSVIFWKRSHLTFPQVISSEGNFSNRDNCRQMILNDLFKLCFVRNWMLKCNDHGRVFFWWCSSLPTRRI